MANKRVKNHSTQAQFGVVIYVRLNPMTMIRANKTASGSI